VGGKNRPEERSRGLEVKRGQGFIEELNKKQRRGFKRRAGGYGASDLRKRNQRRGKESFLPRLTNERGLGSHPEIRTVRGLLGERRRAQDILLRWQVKKNRRP